MLIQTCMLEMNVRQTRCVVVYQRNLESLIAFHLNQFAWPICSCLFRFNWHCVIDKDFSGVWNGTSWSGLINNQWHRQETLKKESFTLNINVFNTWRTEWLVYFYDTSIVEYSTTRYIMGFLYFIIVFSSSLDGVSKSALDYLDNATVNPMIEHVVYKHSVQRYHIPIRKQRNHFYGFEFLEVKFHMIVN